MRFEREVKHREHVSLERRLHVNQDVATAHEVEVRKRRIAENILPREHAQVADGFRDPVSARHRREEPSQSLRRDVVRDGVTVHAVARSRDGCVAQVGAEQLHLERWRRFLEMLEQRDRERIGLFAAGAPGNPDAEWGAGRARTHDLREPVLLQLLEHLRIAEEAGDADQQILIKAIELGRIRAEILEVITPRPVSMHEHPAKQPPLERPAPILREVHAGAPVQQGEDLLQRLRLVRLVAASGGGRRKICAITHLRHYPEILLGRRREKLVSSPTTFYCSI